MFYCLHVEMGCRVFEVIFYQVSQKRMWGADTSLDHLFSKLQLLKLYNSNYDNFVIYILKKIIIW